MDGSYDDITKANDTGTDTVEDTDSDIYDADYNVAGDADYDDAYASPNDKYSVSNDI